MLRALYIITFCLFIFSINSCEKETTPVPEEYLNYDNQSLELIYPFKLIVDSVVVDGFSTTIGATYETKFSGIFYDLQSGDNAYSALPLDSLEVVFDSDISETDLEVLPYTILPDNPIEMRLDDKGEWNYIEFEFCLNFVPNNGSTGLVCFLWGVDDIIRLIGDQTSYYVFGKNGNVFTMYFRFEK